MSLYYPLTLPHLSPYLPTCMDFTNLKDLMLLNVYQYGGKILLALVVFIIGRLVIAKLTKFLAARMNQSRIDRDVQPFLISFSAFCLT